MALCELIIGFSGWLVEMWMWWAIIGAIIGLFRGGIIGVIVIPILLVIMLSGLIPIALVIFGIILTVFGGC